MDTYSIIKGVKYMIVAGITVCSGIVLLIMAENWSKKNSRG
jgi:hypothetical protein